MKKAKKTLTILIGTMAILATLVGCKNSTTPVAVETPSLSDSAAGNDPDDIADDSTQIEMNSELFSERDMESGYDEPNATIINLMDETTEATHENVSINGDEITISDEGVYILRGSLSNGQIIIDADDTDKIQIVLDDVEISHSSSSPIYVKQADKVFITMANNSANFLTVTGEFVDIDDNTIDAVIFSKEDVTINGNGTLTIKNDYGHGITSKDDLVITNGAYDISVSGHGIEGKNSVRIADGDFVVSSGKDGIHSENKDDMTLGFVYIQNGRFNLTVGDDGIYAANKVQIDGGQMTISSSEEGLESKYVLINDGTLDIYAKDDGINATSLSHDDVTIEINGGNITIVMADGDSDAVDSNGDITINGGNFDLTCGSSFDSDGTIAHNGGTVVINGETVTEITALVTNGKKH